MEQFLLRELFTKVLNVCIMEICAAFSDTEHWVSISFYSFHRDIDAFSSMSPSCTAVVTPFVILHFVSTGLPPAPLWEDRLRAEGRASISACVYILWFGFTYTYLSHFFFFSFSRDQNHMDHNQNFSRGKINVTLALPLKAQTGGEMPKWRPLMFSSTETNDIFSSIS